MNTVEGYAMSSWERGYGDFVLVPDLGTLRMLPWHEGTALVLADLAWTDGSPVTASPRQILKAQTDRLAARGWTAFAGTELEFCVFIDSYEQAHAKAWRDLTPANLYNVDYSVLGSGRVEPLMRRIRLGMAGAGHVRRVVQGRVQPRPARDRVPVHGRGDHVRQPFDLQDRCQGDRRAGGHEHHVHGQAERARGQLLPHPPVAAGLGGEPGARRGRALRPVPGGRALPGRAARRACRAHAFLRAERQLLQALRAGQLRPHRRALGRGQPDLCLSAWSGPGTRCARRTGCPAATSTRTWRSPR